MKPKLDRWVIHGNVLVGYVYDYRGIPNGQRVMTEAIRFIDLNNMEAECLDGKYKLKEPGTHKEHTIKIIGTPESSLPKVDSSLFLTPNG